MKDNINDEYDEPLAKIAEKIEHEIVVKSHLHKDHKDECGYCGQAFGPDEIVIEKKIYDILWRFCSEDCYRDFNDSSNFKDDEFDVEKNHNQGKVFIHDDDD